MKLLSEGKLANKLHTLWTCINHLIVANKKENVVLISHRLFDYSRLIRRAGIELEIRRLIEDDRDSDRSKRDFKSVCACYDTPRTSLVRWIRRLSPK